MKEMFTIQFQIRFFRVIYSLGHMNLKIFLLNTKKAIVRSFSEISSLFFSNPTIDIVYRLSLPLYCQKGSLDRRGPKIESFLQEKKFFNALESA